ncbi:MAG: Dihydrolipoamide acyltransferase [Deltaproteobacteria bacterium]|nr:Dihydrolipoamide acyltransferase [Deltaproteobacteria bacterium]
MLIDVVMPQLGESVVEGVVVKWLVSAGDAVAKDQALLTISTDKVDAEIPSPSAGRMAEVLVREGETVPVRTVLARLETESAKAAAPEAPARPPWDEETEGLQGHLARKTEPPLPAPPRVEPAPAPVPAPAAAPAPPAAPAPVPAPAAAPAPAAVPAPAARPSPPPAGRVRITPVVARMAAEHGLDLSRIPGTGIDGRVTRKDVEARLASDAPGAGAPAPSTETAARPAAPAAALPAPAAVPGIAEGDEVAPWTPIRKRIAKHMVASKQTSPHVHVFAEVDMHKAAAHREALKLQGASVTYLPFVMFAAARALREIPAMNALVSGESTILKKDIHIAVAVDTPKGLLVPVVRHADRKTLVELDQAVGGIGARAKAGEITPDELYGGTFSVTNPGAKGNLFGTPIINQPQVGILRMGQVVKRPVVATVEGEDAIVVRPMMYLCLAYDHRVIDGVAGNGFLFRVREILEAGNFG